MRCKSHNGDSQTALAQLYLERSIRLFPTGSLLLRQSQEKGLPTGQQGHDIFVSLLKIGIRGILTLFVLFHHCYRHGHIFLFPFSITTNNKYILVVAESRTTVQWLWKQCRHYLTGWWEVSGLLQTKASLNSTHQASLGAVRFHHLEAVKSVLVEIVVTVHVYKFDRLMRYFKTNATSKKYILIQFIVRMFLSKVHIWLNSQGKVSDAYLTCLWVHLPYKIFELYQALALARCLIRKRSVSPFEL